MINGKVSALDDSANNLIDQRRIDMLQLEELKGVKFDK